MQASSKCIPRPESSPLQNGNSTVRRGILLSFSTVITGGLMTLGLRFPALRLCGPAQRRTSLASLA
jgi:hypothetical protein